MTNYEQELIWAAGFWEGEGSVANNYGKPRKSDGRRPVNITVSADQKDRWVLDRLVATFGGSVSQRKDNGMFIWYLCSKRGVSFLQSIRPNLSPRRKKQIDGRIQNYLDWIDRPMTEREAGGKTPISYS